MKYLISLLKRILNFFSYKIASKRGPASYWSSYMVDHKEFNDVNESLEHFEWRNSLYPGYIDLMPVNEANNLIVLDYGCGPGNDLVGFSHFSKPKELIGADVSGPALKVAKKRLDLHNFKAKLIEIDEKTNVIPLDDNYLDLVHSSGALHHAKRMDVALKEIYRVLKPGGAFQVMIYNYSSLWLHLYTAYVNQIELGKYKELPLKEAFRKLTDGSQVPISECFKPDEFENIVKSIGFKGGFVGASISTTELKIIPKIYSALEDINLSSEHRTFLSKIQFNHHHHPTVDGDIAGINACFKFYK